MVERKKTGLAKARKRVRWIFHLLSYLDSYSDASVRMGQALMWPPIHHLSNTHSPMLPENLHLLFLSLYRWY
jgi:hypothetical protein